MMRAFVTGIAGPVLGDAEAAFLREASPFGLILFRRNIVDPEQLRRLTSGFREAVGWNAPVLIDQEGGRVQRMTEPHWRKYPSAERLAAAAALTGDAMLIRDVSRVMADDLAAVGIDVDCAPCLDLRLPGATAAIGDRAFSGNPQRVAAAGRAFADGLLAGGVLPVIKHLPGHGRAVVDSHLELPVVDASLDDLAVSDFAPFVALADLPAAMTAHVVYRAVDPDRPATRSEVVIADILRGLIGFQGLLFSDDLSMKALSGTLGERAGLALAAGCDVALHCNGVMSEMEEVAAAVPELSGQSRLRADAALSLRTPTGTVDRTAVLDRLDRALAMHDAGASI